MKTRKKYDEEFKRNTIGLMVENGRSGGEVARELGIGPSVINRWKREYLNELDLKRDNTLGGQLNVGEMSRIIHEQKKEIEYLKRQREILKKAASILSEGAMGGMR
jgi:transposase-like protein